MFTILMLDGLHSRWYGVMRLGILGLVWSLVQEVPWIPHAGVLKGYSMGVTLVFVKRTSKNGPKSTLIAMNFPRTYPIQTTMNSSILWSMAVPI